MLAIVILSWLSILPISSGIINCRMACRRCTEKVEHPDMLEVYCAMCDECKGRRREWLEGAPTLLRVEKNEDYNTNYGQQELEDDCPTTPIDEPCDQPHLLTQMITTALSTTTSTTTSATTTRKPCSARPCIKPATSPCLGITCPMPMAIPVCQMCPMQMPGSFYPFTVTSSVSESKIEPTPIKLAGISSATSELYFYLGVPKKLLKQFKLS